MTLAIKRHYKTILLILGAIIIIGFWQPHSLIYGLQRGSLYALIALPLALVLGILGILNLAHGDFLTVGLYVSYMLYKSYGVDPLVSAIPVFLVLLVLGGAIYMLTVKNVLKAGHLTQLLLTFGISMVLIEGINILWTSQPRNVYTSYSYASMKIGSFSFGTYELLYVLLAFVVLIGLQLFLKKTRLGQATFAVGQNPQGARIIGINVNFVYLFVFSIAVAILGLVAGVLLPRISIFPTVGSPFSLKSFALAAMAGLGNLNGILLAGISLGICEAVVQGIPGYGGWSDLVFFGVLVVIILARSFRGAE
ncbi:MAG: branched-chain amino acid ABC transporter permease [Halanaerobium sp.]|nr:branched-chain amino acid ABC transporter permease [Halanaerobium sp.]